MRSLVAIADRKETDRVCANVPHIEVLMEVLFTDPEYPSKVVQQALVNMPPDQARDTLLFVHYASLRLLQVKEYRQNVYRTAVTLVEKPFGPNIVTDEVKDIVEQL